MEFPIAIFANIAAAVLFFLFWMTVFVILYHLVRFGIGTQPKKLAAAFFLGSVTFFCAGLIFFLKIDWTGISL